MVPAAAAAPPTPTPAALSAVTAEARDFHREGGQPGIAFGVVAGGRLVHSGGFGELRCGDGRVPDLDTGFRIASMTKSFTASTVLLLRDEGALRLDDPAGAHLPELAGVRGPTADSPPITVRHLLTMAAGFPTDDPWGDRQQGLPVDRFADLVRGGGLGFAWAPGTAFEYSNLGYALLGLLIERVTGEPYRDVVGRRLLTPLGLTSTGFDPELLPAQRLATGHRRGPDGGWQEVPFDPYGAFAPMGGLFSTVRDLARWIAGFTDAFPPRDDPEGEHPLRRASRRELQQPHRGLPPQLIWPSVDDVPAVRASGYGFGLLVEHHQGFGTIVGHSGGYPGFGSHMRWHPRSGLGVVVLCNATYAGAYRPASRMLTALLTLAARSARRAARSGRPGSSAAAPGARRPAVTAAQPPPAGDDAWAATRAARKAVERLVNAWDDKLAARLFAENVDLDRPLTLRRAELEQVRERLGPLVPDPSAPVDLPSPAQCSWWMRGPGGRVQLEILLTPQLPPRVQTLTVTPAPNPGPDLRAAADLVVAQLAQPCPQWPEELATAADLPRKDLARLLRVASAWAGACDIVGVTAGDGESHAVFRLAGEHAELSLTLGLDPVDPRGPATTRAVGTARTVRRFGLAVEV